MCVIAQVCDHSLDVCIYCYAYALNITTYACVVLSSQRSVASRLLQGTGLVTPDKEGVVWLHRSNVHTELWLCPAIQWTLWIKTVERRWLQPPRVPSLQRHVQLLFELQHSWPLQRAIQTSMHNITQWIGRYCKLSKSALSKSSEGALQMVT